jgi:hypothetical protein
MLSFGSKPKVVSLQFYQKMSLHRENGLDIRISSFARLDIMVNFFEVLKNVKLRLKTQRGLAFGFTEKYWFAMKIGRKFILHPCEAHILSVLDVSVLYIKF